MDKTLIIVLDEFSERVLEFSNVTLFDYGFRDEITEFDSILGGYGNVDQTLVTFTDPTGGFYQVTPDDLQYSFERDIDFKDNSSFLDTNGDEVLAYTYYDFHRVNQGSENVINHGDWVVEAITRTLIDPSRTDILAIDVDTQAHYFSAFQEVATEFDGVQYNEPALVKALFDYLIAFDAEFNPQSDITYLPAAFTVSLGENVVSTAELDTLDYFELFEIPIFQASANEGQGGVDWGSVYQNVINVGAWNVAQTGELKLSSIQSLPNVDLAGDGLLERADWGATFGTSFATPRIAAEFINLANEVIADLNAQGNRVADYFDTTFVPPEYSQLVASAIPTLTTDVSITFDNPNFGTAILPISNGTLANNGTAPRFLPVTVPGHESGLAGTTIAALSIIPDSTTPTDGPDFLTGTNASETLSALGSNDIVSGLGGNDQLDGGPGIDTALYSGPQFSYTLVLEPSATTLIDRRPEINGTDTLSNFEFLDFTVDELNGPFDLTQFGGTTGLSPQAFESFIELYIAYFNRAPDAIGLNFWGTAFANGTTLDEMAALFGPQEETLKAYPLGTSNEVFATTVYNNVLGRTPDQAGIDFWVGQLGSGNVSRDQFILEVLRGAKSELKPEEGQAFVDQQIADRAYLENKVDIGAYFAVHKGMSNVDNAADAMAFFGDQDTSDINGAVAAIDGHFQSALDPYNGEFLMQVIGVLDTPFVA